MVDSDKNTKKGGFTLDWLVGGALTRIGETVDRVTGRGWNPSSSLATSKLSEKLCFLLDAEARTGDHGGKFAPHVITLKMQWNKFSSDSDEELGKLRDELHAAAIDHINDKLYHTYAPVEIEIKTDYFTEGVRISGSFDKFGADQEEATINVTLPNIQVERTSEGSRASIDLSDAGPVESPVVPVYILRFEIAGKSFEKKLDFSQTKRYTIGRGSESGIPIDHPSVSKVHASLVRNSEGQLLVADTGSTNGTYVGDKRIAYGKAAEIGSGETIKFGIVQVEIAMPQTASPPGVQEITEVLENPVSHPVPPTVAGKFSTGGIPPILQDDSRSLESQRDPDQFEKVDSDDNESNSASDANSREDWEI